MGEHGEIMWQAIAYISSGLTLVAFLAAVVAWILKGKTEERERLIRTAKADQRADLVRNALEFFHVDTPGLTREQQYNVAIEQIRARAQRFRITAVVICCLAAFGAVLAAYAISINAKPSPPLPIANGSSEMQFEAPILLDFLIQHSNARGDSAAFQPSSYLSEDGTNLLDITLSYEGGGLLVFQGVQVRHFAGPCLSMPTGRLISHAAYRYQFHYDESEFFRFEPRLVLNPSDASLLNFQIELAPAGRFPSTCGSVFAKLFYFNGSGEWGVLPLATRENVSDGKLEFPVFSARTGSRSGIDATDFFEISEGGAIMGRSSQPPN